MKLIICVCRGNIARSPVAAKIIARELQSKGLSATHNSISRGIQGTIVDPQPVKFPNITYYEELYRDSKPTLDKLGIDLSSHISTPIDEETAEAASILLAMDNKTKQALYTLFPDQAHKIHLLSELTNEDRDIVDPETMSGKERQEKIFSQIQQIILKGFPQLLKMI